MREYDLLIPRDCAASEDPEEHERVLELMQRVQEANISPSTELDLNRLAEY